MVEIQRFWRIEASPAGAIQVRLSRDSAGNPRVLLEQLGVEQTDETGLELDVAQALALAVFEACQIARAHQDDSTQETSDGGFPITTLLEIRRLLVGGRGRTD
jgi:hypothetical protein